MRYFEKQAAKTSAVSKLIQQAKYIVDPKAAQEAVLRQAGKRGMILGGAIGGSQGFLGTGVAAGGNAGIGLLGAVPPAIVMGGVGHFAGVGMAKGKAAKEMAKYKNIRRALVASGLIGGGYYATKRGNK